MTQSLRRTRSEERLDSQPPDIFPFEEYDESGGNDVEKQLSKPYDAGDNSKASSFVARSYRRKSPSPPTQHSSYPLMTEPHLATDHPFSAKGDDSSLDSSITRQNHFILMEDLTGRLKHSCVLDLKMGTRQYGLDAMPLKKKSHRAKSQPQSSREHNSIRRLAIRRPLPRSLRFEIFNESLTRVLHCTHTSQICSIITEVRIIRRPGVVDAVDEVVVVGR